MSDGTDPSLFLHALMVGTGGGGGAGGCAIKAEGVCRLVLPGARTWSPLEEETFHAWIGGWLPTCSVGAEDGGFKKKIERWAACWAT